MTHLVTRAAPACGYTLLDILFAVGLLTTVTAAAVPPLLTTVDDLRAAGAARYVSARLYQARLEAVARAADVGLAFAAGPGGYAFTSYRDGNGNGIRTRDIQQGVDRPLAPTERLTDVFHDVDFGVLGDAPPVDSGATPPGGDPIRLGSSNILTFTPLGTSTPGSLYILGKSRAQYVVRIYGATGKIRLLKLNPRSGKWGTL